MDVAETRARYPFRWRKLPVMLLTLLLLPLLLAGWGLSWLVLNLTQVLERALRG